MLALHPTASLPTEEPEVVKIASEPLVPDPPRLLSPHAAPILPAMNIEPIRGVGPGGGVKVPPIGLAAGERDQLPCGGLCDGQWRRPDLGRTYPDHCMLVSSCFRVWEVCRDGGISLATGSYACGPVPISEALHSSPHPIRTATIFYHIKLNALPFE